MEFHEMEKDYYIDLWRKRKSSGMSQTGKAWDERSIGWVKSLKEDESAAARSERRVKETAEYLRSRGLLGSSDEVIDIGCGPGRFVCEFAKTAGHVTGIDISENMCRFGQEHAQSLGLTNTEFIPCNFLETDIEAVGWNEKYDLVFSSITPAMSSYESLLKSEKMSRKYCFQSNYINVTDSLEDVVLKEVLPEELLPTPRNLRSFYVLFNILLLEGRYPETRYFRESEELRAYVDDALVEHAFKMTQKGAKEQYFDKVKEAILKRADKDGFVDIHREWDYGWILWDVRNNK